MKKPLHSLGTVGAIVATLAVSGSVKANAYRQSGKSVVVAGSNMKVLPPRDWNELSLKPGKKAETWTLDGEQLNDVTFFGDIAPGEPLIRERNKKREPLPKFTGETLVVELPELLEATYRTEKKISQFQVTGSIPLKFVGAPGIGFTYEYTDNDNLVRKGEARASIVNHKLYMITFDAPKLYFFEKQLNDFRSLADSATIH